MRTFTIGALFLVLVLLPVVGMGQSLGSVAKKERERREKNKERGVAVREITEEEVFGEDEKTAEGEDGSEGDETAPSEEGDATERSPLPARIDVPVEDEAGARSSRESDERRRSEAEWRSRMRQARERVATAKERAEFYRNLSLPSGGRYVDVNGRTVIGSLEQLRRLVSDAEAELADAEQSLTSLEREARRAGVPPGWLR